MCGGGHNVTVLKRARYHLSGYQPTDVGHVSKKHSLALVSDLFHSLVVNETRVGTGAGYDHLIRKVWGDQRKQRVCVYVCAYSGYVTRCSPTFGRNSFDVSSSLS